jgi:hypothetical protein
LPHLSARPPSSHRRGARRRACGCRSPSRTDGPSHDQMRCSVTCPRPAFFEA